jgi:hypothetical protein
MNFRTNSQSGVLYRTFNILTMLVIEEEAKASMRFSLIKHYEPN